MKVFITLLVFLFQSSILISQTNLIQEIAYRWPLGETRWVKEYKIDYKFFPDKKLKSKRKIVESNNEWRFGESTHYEFNSEGKLIYQVDRVGWKEPSFVGECFGGIKEIFKNYDDKGNLVQDSICIYHFNRPDFIPYHIDVRKYEYGNFDLLQKEFHYTGIIDSIPLWRKYEYQTAGTRDVI